VSIPLRGSMISTGGGVGLLVGACDGTLVGALVGGGLLDGLADGDTVLFGS